MSLPPIILFGQYWDCYPRKVQQALIPTLATLGYKTICMEEAPDCSETEIFSKLRGAIEEVAELSSAAEAIAAGKGVDPRSLHEKPVEALHQLLQGHVPNKGCLGVAKKIKSLPAARLKLAMLTQAKELGFQFKGIDIGSRQLEAMMRPASISGRAHNAELKAAERADAFVTNLLKLHSQKEGIIFFCGAIHAQALITRLTEKGLSEERIVASFPHTTEQYMRIENIVAAHLERSPTLRGKSCPLTSDKDVEALADRIVEQVHMKSSRYIKEVESLYAKRLARIFDCTFKAFEKGEYFIDVRTEKNEALVQRLTEKKIPFYYEGDELVIPNVNTPEVSPKIHSLDKS